TLDVVPAREARRTALGLVLTVTITNRSDTPLTAFLDSQRTPRDRPATATLASFLPEGTAAALPLKTAYLTTAEDRRRRYQRLNLAPGQSADVELAVNWPLLEPWTGGKYAARIALVFEAGGRAQVAVSKARWVTVPPPGAAEPDARGLSARIVVVSRLPLE